MTIFVNQKILVYYFPKIKLIRYMLLWKLGEQQSVFVIKKGNKFSLDDTTDLQEQQRTKKVL